MAFWIKGKSAIFLHTPRCGGTFATAVLGKLGLRGTAIGRKHDCPGVVPMAMTVPHYVFIKHPLSFIRSVYSIQSAWGWPDWPKDIDDGRWWHPFAEINGTHELMRGSFNDFLFWIASARAGWVTSIYEKFAGWPNAMVYMADRDVFRDELIDMILYLGFDERSAEEVICEVEASPAAINHFPKPDDPSREAIAAFEEVETTVYARYGYAKETT